MSTVLSPSSISLSLSSSFLSLLLVAPLCDLPDDDALIFLLMDFERDGLGRVNAHLFVRNHLFCSALHCGFVVNVVINGSVTLFRLDQLELQGTQ